MENLFFQVFKRSVSRYLWSHRWTYPPLSNALTLIFTYFFLLCSHVSLRASLLLRNVGLSEEMSLVTVMSFVLLLPKEMSTDSSTLSIHTYTLKAVFTPLVYYFFLMWKSSLNLFKMCSYLRSQHPPWNISHWNMPPGTYKMKPHRLF